MTEGQLKSKRDEFWDTAPAFEGKSEIWNALKAAVEATEVNDYDLAQGNMNADILLIINIIVQIKFYTSIYSTLEFKFGLFLKLFLMVPAFHCQMVLW